MADVNEEILKHLDAAIELESESLKMYNKFLDKVDNQYAKDVFKRMVEEETRHLEFVSGFKGAIKDTGELDSVDIESLETLKPGEIIAIRDKTKEEATSDYLSALVTIVEFEERAYLFYRELESSVSDSTARQVFRILAEFEKEHFDRFKQELESVRNNPYL